MTKDSSVDQAWAAQFETLIGDHLQDEQTSEPDPFSVFLGDVRELLTPAEMGEADRLTIEGGLSGSTLMEHAGLAVSETVRSLLPSGGRVAVMVGPGNNGGDGYVAARMLAETGYDVTVWMGASREKLKGDAAFAAAAWTGAAKGLSAALVKDADLVVDALFGAGLSKPITGMTAKTIEVVNESDLPVVSVDLPSGIDGDSGQVMGVAVKARETVTFFRMKPGHVLYPGRSFTGRVSIADIGIDPRVLETIKPRVRRNHPDHWSLPEFKPFGHKYDRGHTVVLTGGASSTGAARLAARGALRIGSGLVTVAARPVAVPIVASALTAIMVRGVEGPAGLSAMLEDARYNTVILGPGLGVGGETRALVGAALRSKASIVLDADALTSFSDESNSLHNLIKDRDPPVVLTPHEGEFARLFPQFAKETSKLERARQAARASGAVVILKGADTVIAQPDGAAAINDNATAWLATAGSGDVLAGFAGGLMAQGMSAMDAACAAVWLHGAAGQVIGRGLIAEDLPEALPQVFAAREAGRSGQQENP